jgi:ABC-type dipeptide/oligopeptide/nickel transport system permease component
MVYLKDFLSFLGKIVLGNIAIMFGWMLSGTIIVEEIFGWRIMYLLRTGL